MHKADKGEEELKKTPKGETDGEGEKRILFYGDEAVIEDEIGFDWIQIEI